MDAVQVQRIEHGDDIFSEQFNRIRARSGRGLTVTSRVVTQAPELLTKLMDLRFPHGIIRAEGIREHQHGRTALAFQRVMNAGISGFKDGHRAYYSPAESLPQLARRLDSATRAPESRQFLGLRRCTWCRAHICHLCAKADRAPWLPAARRWHLGDAQQQSRHRWD